MVMHCQKHLGINDETQGEMENTFYFEETFAISVSVHVPFLTVLQDEIIIRLETEKPTHYILTKLN